MSDTTTHGAAARPTPTWLLATIGGLLGLFYAYAVWNALAFLIDFSSLGLNGYGWFVLLFAVGFPLLAFGVAFALGYRRPAHHYLLILLTGLGLVAVFWLNIVAYTTLNSAALLG